MQIEINNKEQLLEFIKSNDVSIDQAKNLVSKALDIFIISDFTKDQLIQDTKKFIDDFSSNQEKEIPLFL